MDKSAIVADLKRQLRTRHTRALAALAGAREAATGDDTKAESKYDTRGLEASYLAAGQAEQVEQLGESLAVLDRFTFREFDVDDPVAVGALVETERDGELHYYLLAPTGGGLSCESEDGETVTVLGPASPLGQKLLGHTTGTVLDEPSLAILEVM